jgi:transcriptional antiterminator RfaH
MSGADWYVIYTYPKCEAKAAEALRRAGFGVFCPLMKIDRKLRHRRKGGRAMTRTVEAVMFPRYLFVRFGEGCSFFGLRQIPGVESVLMSNPLTPARVPDSVVEDLRVAVDMGLFDAVREKKPVFRPGTDVRIEEGPFEGFTAVVRQAMAGKTAEVLIELLGSPRVLRIGLEALRAA